MSQKTNEQPLILSRFIINKHLRRKADGFDGPTWRRNKRKINTTRWTIEILILKFLKLCNGATRMSFSPSLRQGAQDNITKRPIDIMSTLNSKRPWSLSISRNWFYTYFRKLLLPSLSRWTSLSNKIQVCAEEKRDTKHTRGHKKKRKQDQVLNSIKFSIAFLYVFLLRLFGSKRISHGCFSSSHFYNVSYPFPSTQFGLQYDGRLELWRKFQGKQLSVLFRRLGKISQL